MVNYERPLAVANEEVSQSRGREVNAGAGLAPPFLEVCLIESST